MTTSFVLHTNASFQTVSAVLSVVRGNVEQPVGYYSKALTKIKKNYAATEIEYLAIIKKVVDHFAIHLLEQPLTIIIDDKSFEAPQSSGKLNAHSSDSH